MKHYSSLVMIVCSTGIVIASAAAELTPEQLKQLPPAATATISFGKDVKAILAHRCFECHANGKRKGGLQLTSREDVLKGGKTGPSIVVGKSAESLLIHQVVGLDPDSIMPKKGDRLTAAEIGVLRAWIDQGLKWDELTPISRAQTVDVKPRHPQIPAGAGNPIDRILEPYFARNGVNPGKPVDDRVYARRVYLDVIGILPPTQELNEFLADTQPNKRERLVRKLFVNYEAYSAHWMSFWGDLLRNGTTLAGIDGHANVNITPWLENALKTNMPYNQLVAELVSPKKESAAFLKGVVMRGVVPASQTMEMQAAQNVSQVFLGVQIKCASCHDSFVSRWTLEDAYGLASIFADKPVELVRCEIPQGKTAHPRFLYPELGELDPKAAQAQRLQRLAELITKPENGQFTRTIVNRLWGRFFGRALVEPVDEMENEPWNRDLLDFLATDLSDNGYDLKKLIERILTSNAYQMPAVPSVDEKKARESNYIFKGPKLRRMTAEQFLDGVNALLGENHRVYKDGANSLLEALGRPDRNTVTTVRDSEATTLQALEMINGPVVQKLIYTDGVQRIKDLVAQVKGAKQELVNKWFLHAYQREPSASELKKINAVGGAELKPEEAADLLWVMVMLPEFQIIR